MKELPYLVCSPLPPANPASGIEQRAQQVSECEGYLRREKKRETNKQ
jgi:hypothetical protein